MAFTQENPKERMTDTLPSTVLQRLHCLKVLNQFKISRLSLKNIDRDLSPQSQNEDRYRCHYSSCAEKSSCIEKNGTDNIVLNNWKHLEKYISNFCKVINLKPQMYWTLWGTNWKENVQVLNKNGLRNVYNGIFFVLIIVGGHKFFPCFGLLVMYALGLKARVDPFLHAFPPVWSSDSPLERHLLTVRTSVFLTEYL